MAEVSGMTLKKDGSLLLRRKCLSESKCNAVFRIDGLSKKGDARFITVESRYNGTAMNGNMSITKSIFKSLEKFSFIFYIGNNRNMPLTHKNYWSLEIR